MYIKIDKSGTKSLGTDLKSCSSDLKKEIANYKKLANSLPSYWTGEDATKYVNAINDKFIPALNDLQKSIENYASYLENVGNCYTGLDNTYSSKKISV